MRTNELGRAVGPRPMSGCGPGTRATCSAVLSGALEAYPPLGTTPGVLGGRLVAGYRISPGRRYRDPFCNSQKSIGGERGLLHNLLFYRTNRNNTWQRPAIRLCGRGKPPICAADLSNKGVLFPIIPLTMGTQVLVCSQPTNCALLI